MKDTLMAGEPVVAGVDGSVYGLSAVEVAVAEAVRRGRTLLLVRVVEWPFIDSPVDREARGKLENEIREHALRDLAVAQEHARAVATDLEIRSHVAIGSASGTLVRMSKQCSQIVLGAHGRSVLTDLLAGSVAIQVATHAHCPVLVVRGHADPAADIVLGTDGSPASEPAARYAFAEADLRGVNITAVHAWRHPISTGLGDEMFPAAVRKSQVAETDVLENALEPYYLAHPHVKITECVVRGGAASALIEASAAGQLVVVGARGHGGFGGLLLGSVGQALIHRAQCPVAIVRPQPVTGA